MDISYQPRKTLQPPRLTLSSWIVFMVFRRAREKQEARVSELPPQAILGKSNRAALKSKTTYFGWGRDNSTSVAQVVSWITKQKPQGLGSGNRRSTTEPQRWCPSLCNRRSEVHLPPLQLSCIERHLAQGQ